MPGQLIQRGERAWTLRVFQGRDASGKRRYLNRTIRGTKKDAQKALNLLLGEKDSGTLADAGRKTVGEFLDDWIATTGKARLRPRTQRDYLSILKRYVTPDLRIKRLSALTSADIQRRYSDLGAKGLSPRTVRFFHAVLRSALAEAVRWNLLSRNPADIVTLPRQRRMEMKCLNQEEAGRFLSAATEDRWAAFWILLLTSGLRPGEACGLKWGDLEDGRIRVQRSLIPGYRGTWELEEPKTARSVRSIPLPASVVQALQRHRATQAADRLRVGSAYQDLGFIFANEIGNPIDSRNLAKHNFPKVLKAAGLPPMRLYDLRHTSATLLLAAGEHPKVVSERLGHASIVLTLDTYSHVLPDMQQAAAAKLESMLFGNRRSGS